MTCYFLFRALQVLKRFLSEVQSEIAHRVPRYVSDLDRQALEKSVKSRCEVVWTVGSKKAMGESGFVVVGWRRSGLPWELETASVAVLLMEC